MADGPSAEDAAADLGDGDSHSTRDRHKPKDASSSTTSPLSTGQDTARRVHEVASVLEAHPHHRQQHRPPRRTCHAHSHPPRRHPVASTTNHNNNNNNNNNSHNPHCHREDREKNEEKEVDGRKESVSGVGTDATRVVPFASSNRVGKYDDGEEEEDDEDKVEKEKNCVSKCRGSVVRIDVAKTAKEEKGDFSNGSTMECFGLFLEASTPNEANERDRRRRRRVDEDGEKQEDALQKVNRLGCDNGEAFDEGGRKTDGIGGVGNSDDSGSSSSDASGAVPAAVSTSGAAANGSVAGRHQGSSFKGQVRTAEDTLVGPCGKKRCADRYDSSESSDR